MNGAHLGLAQDSPSNSSYSLLSYRQSNPSSNSLLNPLHDLPHGSDPPPEPATNSSAGASPGRLHEIFPPGFGSRSSSAHRPFTYEPNQLHVLLSLHPHDQSARTVVTSAWYGKQKKGAGHEFIVFIVEDLAAPGPKNFVCVDRNQNGTGGSTKASKSTQACDAFRVSYDGNLRQFLRDCELTPHRILEEVKFQPDEQLSILNLAALVSDISGEHKTYHAVAGNCYWFAGLIWECLRCIRPKADYHNYFPNKRGRKGFVRHVPNPNQVQAYSKKFRDVQDSLRV